MDEQAKTQVLRMIPYGIVVTGVKSADGSETELFTTSWVTQCSFTPPLLAVAVRHDSKSGKLMRDGRVFTLSFLKKDQKKAAAHFTQPDTSADYDRAPEVEIVVSHNGAPCLKNVLGCIECEVREIISAGDHDLAIGEVIGAELEEDGEPLTLADTKWHYGG